MAARYNYPASSQPGAPATKASPFSVSLTCRHDLTIVPSRTPETTWKKIFSSCPLIRAVVIQIPTLRSTTPPPNQNPGCSQPPSRNRKLPARGRPQGLRSSSRESVARPSLPGGTLGMILRTWTKRTRTTSNMKAMRKRSRRSLHRNIARLTIEALGLHCLPQAMCTLATVAR